jgi:hypothetical protein
MPNDAVTIRLRLSPFMKTLMLLSILVGIAVIINAANSVLILISLGGLTMAEAGLCAVAILIPAYAALLAARFVMIRPGELRLEQKGLVVDTAEDAGVAPWSEVLRVGTYRYAGIRGLGIELADPDGFVARAAMEGTQARSRRMLRGFNSMIFAVAPPKIVNVIASIFGQTPLPPSAGAKDLLHWRRENHGFHLLIPSFYLPDLDAAASAILDFKARAEVAHARHGPPVKPGYKKCPMCAELVRDDACICRFCHHAFADTPVA